MNAIMWKKATRAACRYLKDAYAKYKDWVAVAASYNAGQARIASQLAKQDVDDSLDLQLVEETARYVYRILAAKIMFSDPTAFGFRLRASDLYPAIPYTEITVTEGIANLARFARSKGITLAILKNMNPWLRETSLANHSKRTYKLKIPTKEGMYYNPQTVVPHDKKMGSGMTVSFIPTSLRNICNRLLPLRVRLFHSADISGLACVCVLSSLTQIQFLWEQQ